MVLRRRSHSPQTWPRPCTLSCGSSWRGSGSPDGGIFGRSGEQMHTKNCQILHPLSSSSSAEWFCLICNSSTLFNSMLQMSQLATIGFALIAGLGFRYLLSDQHQSVATAASWPPQTTGCCTCSPRGRSTVPI